MHGADPGARVEALLEDGVRGLVDKAFFIRLAMLRRDLGAQDDRYDRVFELIGRFTPPDVCRLATPFFWFNVLRLDDATLAGPAAAGFITTAIDAFLPATPPGTAITLDVPARAEGYTFPMAGARFALAPGDRLRHAIDGRIVHERPDGTAVPSDATTRPIPGHPGAALLLADDATLFHDDYRHKIVPHSEHANQLAGRIGSALDLIDALAPALALRMNRMVRWYVPIGSDDLRVHNSFTASMLLGVVFLSDAYSSLRLAEAMVHEYHHNQLFALMAGEELFDEVDGAIWYSPWREDPRPLTGLFHALYVFANVWNFLQRALEEAAFAPIRDEIAEDCVRLRWQLAIGLDQVPMHRIFPVGREILEDVRAIATGIEGAPPELVARHLTAWHRRNPALAIAGT
jgi:HEXXH motif-containing protein